MPADASERAYDVVVVGTGSGGKLAAIELARTGRSVLAVEAGRFGGYCPYVACVPAKSMMYSARAGLSWADAVIRRDEATDGGSDAGSATSLTDEGVSVLRGRALLGRPVDGAHQLTARDADGTETHLVAPLVVLATGSSALRPDLPGLDDVPTWTSEQALSAREQPRRLVVLGGGAVGCELAQAFAGLGTEVTVVEVADRLLPGETSWVGELMASVLRDDGVQVLVGASATEARAVDRGAALELMLDDGRSLAADRLLIAGGRAADTEGLGLDAVGVVPTDSGSLAVDARCRVLDESGSPVPGLFAVGDLTEPSSFTHSANYQARIVAAEVDGHGHDADYIAVPRAVYTDPTVFCVGMTQEQADERGIAVRTAAFDVSDVERATLAAAAVPPPGRRTVRGRVELLADAESGVLMGAACVGPEADSWGAELALAVRARLDVQLLTDHIRAFPTWSEAIYPAACTLDGETERRK
jgi:pyruvate/2-oxoglutarate dehydrogenase complex dihydrolipoamide dehydrogenase (E3) component